VKNPLKENGSRSDASACVGIAPSSQRPARRNRSTRPSFGRAVRPVASDLGSGSVRCLQHDGAETTGVIGTVAVIAHVEIAIAANATLQGKLVAGRAAISARA
jgi:hypothetical protein